MNKIKVLIITLFLGWFISKGMYPADNSVVVSKASVISGKCLPTLKTGVLLKIKVQIEDKVIPETIRAIGLECDDLAKKMVNKETVLVRYIQHEEIGVKDLKVSLNNGRTFWGFNGEEVID